MTPEHPEQAQDENIQPDSSPGAVTDSARRRFTAALGGGAVILTLAGKPVWANQCTVSGMMSGNLSAPKGTPCQGCTPGYWGACQHLDSWVGFKPTDTFNAVFGVTEYTDCSGNPYTLLDVLNLNGSGIKTCCTNGSGKNKNNNNNNCNQPAGTANTFCQNNPTGSMPGSIGSDPVSTNLGFQAVAALLSAANPQVNYGYTAGQIIDMFRNNYLTNGAKLKDTFDMLNNRGCPLN